jgi:hypothetical protein
MLVLGGLVLGLYGCLDRDAENEAMEMVQYLPAAVVVPRGQEMAAAEAYAAGHPGHRAMWGESSRPLPYYGDRAGMVVKEVVYADLRRGMTVVYLTQMGVQAGGLLVSKERGGWRVKDWGATAVKDRLIDESAIVGVVVIAFVASPDAPAKPPVPQPAGPGRHTG